MALLFSELIAVPSYVTLVGAEPARPLACEDATNTIRPLFSPDVEMLSVVAPPLADLLSPMVDVLAVTATAIMRARLCHLMD